MFVCFSQDFVKLTGGLRSKLVACLDILSWRTLASHVRRCPVQHRIRTTRTVIKSAGLGINEYLFSRTYRGSSGSFNQIHTGLELVRHLLLHENIYLSKLDHFHRQTYHSSYLHWNPTLQTPPVVHLAHQGHINGYHSYKSDHSFRHITIPQTRFGHRE